MLNRDSIRDGVVYNLLKNNQHITKTIPQTPEERSESLKNTLKEKPSYSTGDGVWVFGYGSLLWNPAFLYVERLRGKIYGYHRSYCIWAHLGRGSPDNPGLMLALDRGGSCCGAAYRIAPERIEEELTILWSREMALKTYKPVWVKIHTNGGPKIGITFIINRQDHRYAGRVLPNLIAKHLATAKGSLGTSLEYLEKVLISLEELDIRDPTLIDLKQRVILLQDAGSTV
ncbi:MAG: gamma-glutamylcyclotransferase [Alphaproteobacteria bacterium]|jgi:cation transport protein ChaC|nr:gamma-glutamylcyclotransferase [Alphaproteobacteria bacterium]PPR14373.1 MAG: hypothetical protein CFH42_00126 [Alphaproteobacteria bacterium MarineAlpha12_Bin1]|tara:strand:+ start:22152 stop:22838 length:687 start_codon:yes stop_codon:yes gene_type:complete